MRARDVEWAARRLVALADVACATVRLVQRQTFLMCWACMYDVTGRNIERRLEGMSDEYRSWVTGIALRLYAEERYWREWSHWRARRIATLLIFFAYVCQRSSYHGMPAWRVRGFPRGVLQALTRLVSLVGGKQVQTKTASHGSFAADIAEICASGMMERVQFAWWKVQPWERGKPQARLDPRTGQPFQFAYSQYFLRICPFKDGTRGRIHLPPAEAAPVWDQEPPTPHVSIEAADELQISSEEIDAMEEQWAAEKRAAERAKVQAERETLLACVDVLTSNPYEVELEVSVDVQTSTMRAAKDAFDRLGLRVPLSSIRSGVQWESACELLPWEARPRPPPDRD